MIHLIEYPDLELCKNIYKHIEIWTQDKQKVKAYCDEALQNGSVKVSYETKGVVGRFYPTNIKQRLTATVMWRRLRASLFSNTEYDIDIVNCHACLMLGLVEKLYPNFDVSCLKKYTENRENIINNFNLKKSCPFYSKDKGETITKKDVVKSLFNIMLYGGTIETWAKEFNLLSSDYEISQFVTDFQEEVKTIVTIITRNELMKDNRIKYSKYYTEQKRTKYGDKYDEEKIYIAPRKIIASILQDFERQLITKVMDYTVSELNATVTAYCYDGFQVLKNNFKPEFIDNINEYVSEIDDDFKYCKFIVKDFAELLDMSKIVDNKHFNMTDYKCTENPYETKRQYFENFHFKLYNPPCMVKTSESEPCQYIKMNLFGSMYSNLYYTKRWKDKKTNEEKTQEIKFLIGAKNEIGWVNDPDMRTYERVDTFPPPLKCASNIYNDWSEFPILKTTLDNTADTSLIYKHFDLVSNNDENVKNYLLNWFAHMVQKPGIKSRVALLIHGEQGSGKSTIGEDLMTAIIGKSKMMVTDKIDLLLGRFADTRGKLLVCLNEAKGKDTFNVDNLLKDYITRATCEVEKKGIDAFTATAFDRLIFTTNNENPVPLEEGDRRWFVVSMDNSMKNNMEYFNALHKAFENPIIMRKFYQELMDRDIDLWDPINDRPKSEMAESMIEMNKDPYTCFVAFMLENYEDVVGKQYRGRDLYQKFNEFWTTTGRGEFKPNQTKFLEMVKKRKGVVFKKTSKFNCYEIVDSE